MIKIHCHTNLDLIQEKWPTELPAVPRVGDEIESKTKWDDYFSLSLKVVAVRWKHYDNGEYKPCIELSMNPLMTLREFYEWYAHIIGKSVSYFI